MTQISTEQAVQMALNNHRNGRLDLAETIYRQILQQNPVRGDVLHYLGVLLAMTGRSGEALPLVQRAADLDPNSAEMQNNLGNIYLMEGLYEQAVACYQRAQSLRPNYTEAHNNLGKTLQSMGKLPEAIASYRQAIALSPEFAGAHHNLGMALIMSGDYPAGWREHEWRLRKPDYTSPVRNFAQPQWGGSDLTGKTLLVHTEQGIGDAIQFVRYVTAAAWPPDSKIILECQPELMRLFKGSPYLSRVKLVPQARPSLTQSERFDVHAPLMSLPLAMSRFDPSESAGNYLQADPELAKAWKERVQGNGDFKVGVAWAGNPGHHNDRFRSAKRADFAPLADNGVQLFSLQVGAAAGVDGTSITDLTSQFTDFADTAALISNLDLVISVDTAVAHLAGAMGKPTWLFLPVSSDFRWGLESETTPWYPSMRLFRQKRVGDWSEVIGRVSGALAVLRAAK